jgi:ubiquinone/menaquinone biosynthesis C-methylase UbiE
MAQPTADRWSQWLLQRRFGGDEHSLQATLAYLYPIRDAVLSHAHLHPNAVVLDVGCGDGLIAFGALAQEPTSRVIFSDISHDLLHHAQALAQRMELMDRCQFLHASADDLSALAATSVDIVTTRSVLIYVTAKQQAFHEFYRVLTSHGRLSIFEPINRFGYPEPAHLFWGYDLTPVQELAHKVKVLYQQLQPLDTDPMLDFDERDLLGYAEQAGFCDIHVELQAEVTRPTTAVPWETFLQTAGNPNIPTLKEAIEQTLSPTEAVQFMAHLRPLVASNDCIQRSAVAYLWASKP